MSEATTQRIINGFTVVGALTFLSIGIISLVSAKSVIPAGQNVTTLFEQYLAGRHIVLATMLIALVILREARTLGFFVLAMGLIQLYDAGMLASHAVYTNMGGPIVFAIGYLLSARYLLTHKAAQNG